MLKGEKSVFSDKSLNLMTEKCPDTGSECDVTLVAKVLIMNLCGRDDFYKIACHLLAPNLSRI